MDILFVAVIAIAGIVIANSLINVINKNKHCFFCFGSKQCTNCIFCFFCRNCSNCKSDFNCLFCKRSKNCTNCKSCNFCFDCVHCISWSRQGSRIWSWLAGETMWITWKKISGICEKRWKSWTLQKMKQRFNVW